MILYFNSKLKVIDSGKLFDVHRIKHGIFYFSYILPFDNGSKAKRLVYKVIYVRAKFNY